MRSYGSLPLAAMLLMLETPSAGILLLRAALTTPEPHQQLLLHFNTILWKWFYGNGCILREELEACHMTIRTDCLCPAHRQEAYECTNFYGRRVLEIAFQYSHIERIRTLQMWEARNRGRNPGMTTYFMGARPLDFSDERERSQYLPENTALILNASSTGEHCIVQRKAKRTSLRTHGLCEPNPRWTLQRRNHVICSLDFLHPKHGDQRCVLATLSNDLKRSHYLLLRLARWDRVGCNSLHRQLFKGCI